jgi:hypothetical protein
MDNSRISNDSKDDWLFDMVRRANSDHFHESLRPSFEVVQAFFSGEATNEQRSKVIAALARSTDFRQEMKEIAEDLAAVCDDEVLTNLSQLPLDEAHFPDLSAQLPNSKILQDNQTKKITDLINLRIVTPLVAAAAALVLWFSPLVQRAPQAILVSEAVDPGNLISQNVRSTDDKPVVKAFDSAEDAAYAGFREMLVFEDYVLGVNPDFSSPFSHTEINVTLSNNSISVLIEESIAEFLECDDCDVVQGWLLALPSRRLWSFDPAQQSLEIDWQPAFGDVVCITFTYREKEAYLIDQGIVFNLNE